MKPRPQVIATSEGRFLPNGEDSRRLLREMGARAGEAFEVRRLSEAAMRTVEQNRKLWPMLNDCSEQIDWHGHTLTPDEWKDFFTATLNSYQRAVPNADGTGFVIVGGRTSTMTVANFIALVDLIYAFGGEQGVVWSEPRERDAA